MFFVNEAHRKNYESLLNFYASSLPSIEYEVACYILALPEVLKRIPEDHSIKLPFDWVHHWEDENDESTKRLSDAIFYMDDPYKHLVFAGMHMYNGEIFRLNSGLSTWNDTHFQVFIQACKIRGKL
ncbi:MULTISPECIES: DUF2538 family protein [Paenibacillus]|uniref:DUF5672 domain-containing protein n=1 Tax=Paenibacillus odorifer TaxID=189426 RepID=A0AB36J2X5_9BACL|nr:DUF2538 family protein [Paenibacillus odorifer]OMD10603.1 hypothetical protein BJP50_28220 [Paenibacillus odorifer]OME07448.1 hypothetical protein BSK60_31490 [Paenibacillus odorifer]OME10263.1 hypothetical protein BSK47_31070 [Paenibacillus odorifer]